MYKNILLAGLLLLLHVRLKAQNDTISQRIVLIGDAGQLTNGRHPVVDAVRNLVPLDEKTIILYMGDNIYPNGLPVSEYSGYGQYKAILDSQISIAAGTKAKVYMIPGNHDWKNGSRDGYQAILREQNYVTFYLDSLGKSNVKFFPEEGCPGPVEISLGNDAVIIVFDSQWWLHPYDKPDIESDCVCKTKDELVEKIGQLAARNANKLVILASHHPFKSYGVH
ncbi:MAG: metallophosphoesterase, partial [Chitinophagaceae bacterium]